MHMHNRRRWAIAALGLALVASGCASKHNTGSDTLLNFKDKTQQELGAAASSPKPSHTPTAAPVGTAHAAIGAATARRSQSAPQNTPAAPAFIISINGDTSAAGSQFTPSVARVYAGQVVTWTNKDKIARSVVADKGEFSSGPIAPGKSFSYTAKSTGQFSYHDGTRPYAVASLEVLKR